MPHDVMPLLTDLKFPEAPRWHDGALWFSDMVAGTVHRLEGGERDGSATTVATLDDKPGGLGFLPDGTPVVAGMHTSTLYTLDTGSAVAWVDLTEVADGHLDDMVIGADGVAWVGGVGHMSQTGPVPRNGRLLRVEPGGVATTAASDLAFPNGAALAADGRTLVLAETFASQLLAFTVEADGSLSHRRVFAALPGLHPDGLTLDASGAAWVGCFLESRFVRVEQGGRITHVVDAGDRWATGVWLGGSDGRTLFMCSADADTARFFAGTTVGRIDTVQVDVPGLGH